MKLLRYGTSGAEKPAILDADGAIRDLSGHVADIGGKDIDPATLATLANLDLSTLPLVEGTPRIGPCVAGTGKFICIGLNYADHSRRIRHGRSAGTRDLHEGDLGDRRPER